MPNKTIHPPPCLFLRSPATRTHANPSPAFGLISTYSHRVPGRSVQPHQANRCLNHNDEGSRTRGSPDDNNRGGDESAFEFEQVAAASVSIPQPSPTRQMSFEVREQASLSIEDPIVYRKPLPRAREGTTDQSDEKRLEPASVASDLSSSLSHNRSLGHLCTPSISLSHCAVSQESLVAAWPSPPRPPLPRSRSPSCSMDDTDSTRTLRPGDASILSCVPNPHASLFVPPGPPVPALASTFTGRASRPPDSRTRPLDSLARPTDETRAAQRLQRLYLCPWESNEPPATAVRARATLDVRSAAKGGEAPIAVLEGGGKRTVGPGESRSGGFGYKQEKRYGADRPNSEAATTVVVEFPRSGKAEQEVGEQERREATRARNSYLVKLGIVTLLSIALMVDLVVINVRLFTREDWE